MNVELALPLEPTLIELRTVRVVLPVTYHRSVTTSPDLKPVSLTITFMPLPPELGESAARDSTVNDFETCFRLDSPRTMNL